jgi:hypothetical protein
MVIRLISLKNTQVKHFFATGGSLAKRTLRWKQSTSPEKRRAVRAERAGAQARVTAITSARMRRIAIIIAALVLETTPAAAQCTSQPALGGGTITSCSASDGERTQYRTRETVGGGTITTRATSTRTVPALTPPAPPVPASAEGPSPPADSSGRHR